MPVPEAKPPRQGLRLKSIKAKTLGTGTSLAHGTSPRPLRTTLFQTKAATLPTRAVLGRPRTPLCETSRNITPPTHKSIQKEQRLALENGATVLPSRVIINAPAAKMRLQTHKRTSIIPKSDTASVFARVQPSQTQANNSQVSDAESNSSPIPRVLRHGDFLIKNSCAGAFMDVAPPSVMAPVIPKIRSALSLPSRRLNQDSGREPKSKTVRWDPSIIATGPVIQPKTDRQPTVDMEEIEVDQHPSVEKLNIEENLETVIKWKKSDKSKLEKLLKVLRELDYDHEENEIGCEMTELGREEDKVVITVTKSLDPRVPEFHSRRGSNMADWLDIHSLLHPTAKLEMKPAILKENVPMQRAASTLSWRQNTVRKRAICDDYLAPGREVEAFEQWYAEKQLVEFMKKYPMTGRKPPVVPKQTPANHMDHHVLTTGGPAAGRHAAAIQQRLEFLLLKKKERKAMEKVYS